MPGLSCKKQHSQAILLIPSDRPEDAISQPLPSCHHFPCLIFREMGNLNWSLSKENQSSRAGSAGTHVDSTIVQTQSSGSPTDAYSVCDHPIIPQIIDTDLTHSLNCLDSCSLVKQREFSPLTNPPGNKNKMSLAHKPGFQPSFDL